MTIATQDQTNTPSTYRGSVVDMSNQAITDVGMLVALLALVEDLVCQLSAPPHPHGKIDMICAAAKAGAEMGARTQADLDRMRKQIWELAEAASREGKERGNVDQ